MKYETGQKTENNLFVKVPGYGKQGTDQEKKSLVTASSSTSKTLSFRHDGFEEIPLNDEVPAEAKKENKKDCVIL